MPLRLSVSIQSSHLFGIGFKSLCDFFYVTPLGLCLIISVFYDYVTPLGLLDTHHLVN